MHQAPILCTNYCISYTSTIYTAQMCVCVTELKPPSRIDYSYTGQIFTQKAQRKKEKKEERKGKKRRGNFPVCPIYCVVECFV